MSAMGEQSSYDQCERCGKWVLGVLLGVCGNCLRAQMYAREHQEYLLRRMAEDGYPDAPPWAPGEPVYIPVERDEAPESAPNRQPFTHGVAFTAEETRRMEFVRWLVRAGRLGADDTYPAARGVA